MLSSPEWQMTEQEASEYAKALAAVSRHYDMGASAKTLDWINLGTTMASIYGVRVMAISARRKDAKQRGGNNAPPLRDTAQSPAPMASPENGVIDMTAFTGGGPGNGRMN